MANYRTLNIHCVPSSMCNKNQYRFLTAAMQNPVWQTKIGSRNCLPDIIDRNTFSNYKTMYLRVAFTMEHRPTVKTNSVYVKCNTADPKPEVKITFVTL